MGQVQLPCDPVPVGDSAEPLTEVVNHPAVSALSRLRPSAGCYRLSSDPVGSLFMGSIAVEYTKWGGARHWHFPVDQLGADEHGTWYSGPPGIHLQRGDEPPVLELDGFVMLVPGGTSVATKDWIAFWNPWDGPAIYVDVTDTPRSDGRMVSAIDLDLDVIARRDGRAELVDVDEFDEHRIALGYPQDVVDGALATADWLLDRVGCEAPPFDATGRVWLQRAAKSWPHGGETLRK